MKIVHLSDCYLPRLGGIEMQVRDLARRQYAAGDEVHVITTTPAAARGRQPAEPDGLDGVTVHRLAGDLPYELPVNLRAPAGVRQILDAARGQGQPFEAAHVHAGVVSPFAFSVAKVAAEARVPTVITLHCLWGYLTPAFRLLDGRSHWSKWPVVFSAVSEVAALPVRRIAGPTIDVEILPNGIDIKEWAVEPLPRDPADVLIVGVMRLAARKRPMQMLRALREARDLVPASIRMRAQIIGEGPERKSLERYLNRARMASWVELTGRLTRDQIREVYARADIFVAPANLESFGIAALEARSAGVPVVAKANSGIREFVAHEVEGLLAATDAELAGALVRLCRDADLRTRIAGHNRSVPPSVTWAEVLVRTDAIYAQAARQLAAGPRP